MKRSEINIFEQGIEQKKEREVEKKRQKELFDKNKKLKQLIEALLFSSDEPLSLQQIRLVLEKKFPCKTSQVKEFLDLLKKEYTETGRSFELCQTAGGYWMRTRPEFGAQIGKLQLRKPNEKLSRAATEVLAIIAHRQPVSRSSVDQIRGVDSTGAIHALLERELVEIVGKSDGPGKPSLYSVTKKFLQHYGLNDLPELQHYLNANKNPSL